ncbi:hypothetical protein B0I35DRAFT_6985 [Stachybotrys elegans]|uniref:C2H2-type domain-containing protein n=1 Tax=Stachybotrys elegans TaxID=80388 RepID=A0A8K0T0K5_9HYPO|nr:hypothetical protein B0I35DRAFT_6985 [Stachybotrys elegans]
MRNTANDECGLHRFIVWVAVKRNASDKMSPEEKTRCPLLRCRKRFPDHELMLKHLYTCEGLDAAEYWCFEHGRVERFNDSKCRRCLGHPSKRRKIIALAKNFFNSLGHKSKPLGLQSIDMDMSEAPPSYESISYVELSSSTEIHEIDSCEVQLPTIPETAAETEPENTSAPLPAIPPFSVAEIPQSVAELDSESPLGPLPAEAWAVRPHPLWHPVSLYQPLSSPQTVAPENLISRAQTASPSKPILQLHTHGLNTGRIRSHRRSMQLAPSSSVRSTASTASTNSTISTTSCNISPMSAWSSHWNRAPGFESTLTSPADDLDTTGNSLPFNVLNTPIGDGKEDQSFNVSWCFPSELPASLPTVDAFPGPAPAHDMVDMDTSAFSFNSAIPTELSTSSEPAVANPSNVSLDLALPTVDTHSTHYTRADSLIETARTTLEMHIADSMNKLHPINGNSLVEKLRTMSLPVIAEQALVTLTTIMEGGEPTCPVGLLCFIHFSYSLSLVIHETDAHARSTDLFSQAMSYGSGFSLQDITEYRQIVECLWKPQGMTADDVKFRLQINASRSNPFVSMSKKAMGKQPQRGILPPTTDCFAFVAQVFLDELEYAALRDGSRPGIQTSELSIQHLKDPNFNTQKDSPYMTAVKFMLSSLCHKYGTVHSFIANVGDLMGRVQSNQVSTSRRLELELMHIGRICLSSGVFFDQYVAQVRTHINSLLEANGGCFNSRSTYYRHGIKLVASIICGSKPWDNPSILVPDPMMGKLGDCMISATPANDPGCDFEQHLVFGSEDVVPAPIPVITVNAPSAEESQWIFDMEGPSPVSAGSTTTPQLPSPLSTTNDSDQMNGENVTESAETCPECNYRPKGNPRWFGGSMAKHKKLQHAGTPPTIYRCPYPGCTSQYRNRPDNLRQHQLDKGHFVDGQGEGSRRPGKRRRTQINGEGGINE